MAPLLVLKKAIESGDEELAKQVTLDLRDTDSTLYPKGNFHYFSIYNIQHEKIRVNTAGLVNAGPARPPYIRIPEEYAEGASLVGRKYAALQEKYSKML